MARSDISLEYEFYYDFVAGSNCKMALVRHLETNERRVAKIIKKSTITNQTAFLKEIKALQKIKHPNILQFYEIFQNEKKFFLIFEYCEGGDLLFKLVDIESINETTAANYF